MACNLFDGVEQSPWHLPARAILLYTNSGQLLGGQPDARARTVFASNADGRHPVGSRWTSDTRFAEARR